MLKNNLPSVCPRDPAYDVVINWFKQFSFLKTKNLYLGRWNTKKATAKAVLFGTVFFVLQGQVCIKGHLT